MLLNKQAGGQTGPSIDGESAADGVIKSEPMMNEQYLLDLRFSLVCVQEEAWGHYSVRLWAGASAGALSS